mgnify:FL=1
MKKKFFLSSVILIFLLLVLNGCSYKYVLIDNGKEKIKVDVEVADNDEERMQGLMFRESLGENSGMLFVFDNKAKYAFWMKNTLIPLDVIFIDENFNIVDIIYAVPCKEDPCERYIPKKESLYVLEVNGNFTIKNGISIGNKIRLL